MIQFVIWGDPKPQKRHRDMGKNCRWKYDPCKGLKKNIGIVASQYKPDKPFTGAIFIKLVFVLSRPNQHYRTIGQKLSDKLKEWAKKLWPIKKPDLDNLEKLVLDALEKIYYRNDSQVCVVHKKKIYGSPPRTEVSIEQLGDAVDSKIIYLKGRGKISTERK